jgi:multidrug efflux pump
MIVSDYSIKFRTAVFVFAVVLVLGGSYSYMHLPREGTPDITIPNVFVTAFYEGTAPSEMEKLVAIPLEKHLGDLENVKEMRSNSAESLCFISIEFLAGQDIDLARQRVKEKVDLAKPDLPADLDEPVVDAINFSSDIPVYILAISGQTNIERLKSFAEGIQEEIELLPGVRQVDLSGVREREIRVEIDLRRLNAYRIPLPLMMQRIAGENATMSAGNIEMTDGKFQVRVPGEYEHVAELRDLVLVSGPAGQVYLRDVAEVTDTYKDLESISRLNGRPSVSLTVKKRARENAVILIDKINAMLEETDFPPGISHEVVFDMSEDVRTMISELENNVASGFLLVLVVLFLFLGARNSLFVALAIPLSMLIAFAAMGMAGQTLNMIVLFSLVLAVGMLVDNAIVIVENTYRNRALGLTRIEAARRGAGEVAWPVITSTLTTVAAFSPLLFWPGVAGQFMGFLPRTLIIVLSASLFVAMVVNPAVCSVFIHVKPDQGGNNTSRKPYRFVLWYEGILRTALQHRLPILLLGFFMLVLTMLLFGQYGRGVEYFPDVEPKNASVSVKFPQGIAIEKTDAVMKDIEQKLEMYKDIKFYLTTVGAGAGILPWEGTSGGNNGTIRIEFVPVGRRSENSNKLIEKMRNDVGLLPGAEVIVDKEEMGPPVGAPITIEVSGDDFEKLSEISAEIIAKIQSVEGLVDLRDDFEEALPELQFHVDRSRAALYGLDTQTIGMHLRTTIFGMESSKFRVDEDEFDITLRLPEDQRNSKDFLDQIFIPAADGSGVPLSSLGEVVYAAGHGSISRKDQKRVVTITGNNQEDSGDDQEDSGDDEKDRGVDKILKDVKPLVEQIKLPPGYSVVYAGETKEQNEAMAFLSRAFIVALGLIVVILVIQFNSVLLPGIILLSVILSLIGVMWGLLVCQMKFGVIMTGVGVISLAGIVVNNAIVLVDCIIQRRKEGLDSTEAIVAAGRMRLRPVLLTAVTTVLGLIPMAIGYSLDVHRLVPRIVAGTETSAWWAPMAVAVIFGLSVATVLTLVLVPVMYSTADSFTLFLRRLFKVEND